MKKEGNQMKKSNKGLVIVLLAVVLVLGAVVAGMAWFLTSHFFLEGHAYPKAAEELDLRDEVLTVAEYEALRKQLPDCQITWSPAPVPFVPITPFVIGKKIWDKSKKLFR